MAQQTNGTRVTGVQPVELSRATLRAIFAATAPKDIPSWFSVTGEPPEDEADPEAWRMLVRTFRWPWHWADMMMQGFP